MKLDYRVLNIEDLEEYKRLRLELLKTEDESFGSSYEEEANFQPQMWTNRLSKTTSISYGAFDKNTLVGIVIGVLNPRKKMKHVGTINSLYVSPEKRGLGIARQLLEGLINILEAKGIEFLKLSVVTTNLSALSLYESLGFKVYGFEQGFIKIDQKYIDQHLLWKILE